MTNDEHRELIAGQARLEGKLETLTAMLKASAERNRDEIGELFRRSNQDGTRISNIERDYVPERDFRHHREKNAGEHKELREAVDAIKTQVTRVVAIGAMAWVAISLVAQVLVRMMWR